MPTSTGDGRPDTVTVRLARWADGRCAFYLRVATAKHMYTLSLGRFLGDLGKLQYNGPIHDWPFRTPAVDAIVDLGGGGKLIALRQRGCVERFRGLRRSRGRPVPLDSSGSQPRRHNDRCDRGFVRAWRTSARLERLERVDEEETERLGVLDRGAQRRRGWHMVAVGHSRTRHGSHKKMWRAGFPERPLLGCSIVRNPNVVD